MLRCKQLLVPLFNVFLMLGLFLLGTQDAHATHAKGVDISYICNGPVSGGMEYELTLNVYRECNGINLGTTQRISWRGTSIGGGTNCTSTVTANRDTVIDITPNCPSQQSSCDGGNGTFGVEQHTYTTTIVVPFDCTDIIFSWRLCCRNNSITTLIGAPAMYAETRNIFNTAAICNNSPVFINPPAAFTCVNQDVFYNHGAVDFDGDSLNYSLIDCLENPNDPVAYVGGYSGIAPFGVGVTVTIDPQTGAISFTPTSQEIAVLCVLVEEYRDGVLIGTTMRDIQFEVLNCNNANPILSGVDNTGQAAVNFITTTCFGSQLCFDIVGSDPPNPGDVLSMSYDGAIPNSTFTVTGPGVPSGNQITGTFCWTPTVFDIGTSTFTVTIQDDACPLVGTNTFTYTINVVANPNDPVDAGLDASICVGDCTPLSATTTSPNGVSYSWSPTIGLSDPNIPNPVACPPSTTTYSVVLTYNDGCTSTDQVTVIVEDDPPLAVAPNNINTCGGSPLVLTATTDAPSMNFTFTELLPLGTAVVANTVTGATASAPVTIPTAPGIYQWSVVVSNPFTGCTSSEIITITVGDSVVPVACRNIYVSTTGSAGASGSQFDPVTVQEALRRAACNNSVIKIATGTYNIDTALNITSNLTVEGGFIQGQAWLKTSEIGATTINRTTNNAGGVLNSDRHLTAVEVFGSSFFRLQDLTITTDDALVPGTSTYGIFMNNAASYNITRVNVEPGNATNGSDGVVGCAGTDGTTGNSGQDGLPDTQDDNIQGGNGGFGGNSCGSFAVVFGGGGGRNADLGNGIGVGASGSSASASVVDGGAGGGGGRGGNAADGASGGASGRGGTPLSPPAGCSATGSGQGSSVTGGLGGGRNTLADGSAFNNGAPTIGQAGTSGIAGVAGCVGVDGAAGLQVACRYTVGSQGATGMSGSGGSGGGGGGGGGGQGGACGCVNGTGAAGGGGGGGGAAGLGGTGGFGGGGSFGIYMCSNGANGFIEHCHVSAGTAGVGGIGGAGGAGGVGGAGGAGGAGTAAEVQDGGAGGTGGAGGVGGTGGNGQAGIAVNIFWDGAGTIPVAQDSTYELYNQQIIYVENTNCTNADVMFWDSSRIASHPNSTALPQVIPVGLPNTTVTNWTFDAIGFNTVPPTGTFNADTTQYNNVGRYDIIHNTCLGCPAAGGAAGTALEEYRGFHNIAFDRAFKPDIVSSANVIGVDTFQLCVGDFATFGSSIFGDTTRWEFSGAIPNPGNVQNVPSTQFNVSGFFMIELFLITDCCGDTPTDTAYLYVDPVPNVTGSGNQTVCLGDSALLTIAGLSATDTVIWSPLTNLAFISEDSVVVNPTATATYTASVYSIITDGGQTRLSCPVSLSYTVTINPLPTPTMSSTDVVCNNDGTATATPAAGTYNFVWSNGLTENSVATSTAINLPPGTYCVTVTNVITGCVDTGCIFVAPALAVPGVFATNITSVSCAGANDGSVTIGTINGTAPYTYVWDTIVPGIVSPTSVDYTVTSLAPRDYTVTATDNNGCISTITFNIPTPDPLTLAIIDTTHPVCQNDTGRIEVEGQGGTGLYTYIWSNGTTTASGILSGIDTGFYCVTVVDDNSCTNTFCVNLDAQQVLTTAIDISTPIACNGQTACISVNVTGGSGSYTYDWSGAGLAAPFTTGVDPACNFPADPGAYTVLVTDNTFGCTTTADIFVTEPPLLTTTIASQINVSCFGDSTGIGTVGATGGTSPYTFLWDANANNQTTAAATNLPAGTYCVTVTDSLNCTSVSCVTITEPATGVDVNASVTTLISCFGLADGQATAVGSNGTPSTTGYTYTWSNSQTGPVLTGGSVAGSPYTVVVRDSLGCEDSTTISFTQPAAVTASIASTVSVTCFGDSTGEATAAGAGGTGAYTFQWGVNTGNQTGPVATGLSTIGGPYCVTVTDANGCMDSICVNITQPATALTSNAVVIENANCAGASDGIALASGSGGTGAISFIWDGGTATGQTTAQITGLAAGIYCVTVSDANNCSNVHCVTITEPNAVTATITNFTDAACFGDSTGTATVLGAGGNAGTAYTFVWSTTPAQTTAMATNLAAGIYTVTVSDDSSCTGTTSVTISEPSQVTVVASVASNINGSQVSCPTASDGSVTANASGGTGTYTYGWSPAGAGQTLNGVDTGMYIVTATDVNGCTALDTTIVVPPAPVVVTVVSTSNVDCFGAATGSATVNGSGGSGAPYSYVWTSGATGATNPNLAAGVHCVTVTDVNLCPVVTCVTITEPSTAVSGAITIDTTISCNGGSDGDIHVVAVGGTPFTVNQANGTGYTYIWDNGSTDTSSMNLAIGQHCVTITDSLGCSFVSCVTLTEPTAVTATISATQDISCTGDSTGTATAVGSGGTELNTYDFLWSDGQPTATATDLAANTLYQVTVTDDNGCTAVTSTLLSQPAVAVTAAATVNSDYNGQDVSCNGLADGEISVVGSGGTQFTVNDPYTYDWSTSASNDTLTVGAGLYTVTVTDTLGCTAVATVTVNEPALLTATIAAGQTNISCFGDSTGQATVNANGGTVVGNYAYIWDNGVATALNGNLPAGVQCVTVTDANNCLATTCATITQPSSAILVANATINSNVSCNGGNDGEATVVPSGGTPAAAGYTFVWAGLPQTTGNITGLSAGTYCVTITDSLGCAIDTCVTITQPIPVTASITNVNNVSCFGDSTGSATVTGGGGTALGAYNFLWDANAGNQTTATATGLAANTSYCVTVTDDNGCTATTCVTLTQPTLLTVSGSEVTPVACAGESNGSVQATATGGSGTLNYTWGANTGGATTDTVAGLAAGVYCVTITDSLGCTAETCVTLTEPAGITVTATSVIDVVCRGDSTGEITVAATGGAGGHSFLWDAAAGNQTTQTVAGLAAGTYCVFVTDASGCLDSLCVTLGQPATAVDVTASVISNYNGSQIQCFGDSSGIAVAVATGGTAAIDYQYAWTITSQTSDTAVGLPDGTFCVTVTDDLGCTDTACVTIAEPAQVVATVTATTNVACLGGCTGSATVAGAGGIGSYTYLWDAAAGGQTTATATNLCTGLYGVTVSDVNGCVGVSTVSISEPSTAVQANITISSNFNGQDVSCNNAFDGQATASAVGGTPGYTFQWNGAASGQSTATATGLGANILYCVIITDSVGCIDSACITLVEPTAIIPTIDTTINVSCFGDSTGAATVSATGGVAPYTFVWDAATGNQTTATAIGLAAGSYTVTVIDTNGCQGAAVVVVGQPNGLLDVSAVVTSSFPGGTALQCFGDSSGTALATISGGTGPYTQIWGHGPTTLGVNNLPDGTYCITVTDSLGCMDTACITLSQPTQVVASLVSTSDASCNGGCDGAATVMANGGIPGYTYLWDAAAGSQTTATATGLCAGVYEVSATDANGCVGTFNVTISEPATAVVASAIVTSNYNGAQVSCVGSSDGQATASAVGGTGTYTYVWTAGIITDTLDGVSAGNYCVTVSDANGCSDVACVTITEPSQVTATISTTNNVACLGDSTGSATVVGTGGTGGYDYQWEASADSQTTATAINLTAGSYIVTITDDNGCTSQAIAIISQPNAALVAGATITNNVQCFGDSSGAAQVTVIGGTTPFSIVWDHGPTTAAVTGLPDGTYCAIVTDSLGCMDTACVTLLEPTAITTSVTTTPADCRGTATGTATVTAGGGTPGLGGYTYQWDANAAGQTTATATGLSAANSPYTVTVTDGNGCTTTASAIIAEPATSVNAALVVLSNYNGAQVSCNGSSDAIVGVTLSGGTSPYTYLWSDGTINDTLTGVGAGQHCVTVTDANGCSDIACITVTEPSLVTATIASTNNVACFGECTGTATVSGTGGTENGTYNVLWDANAANQTTATAINLCAGSYNVTITDDNGCTAVTTVIITQPTNALVATVSATSNFNGQQISCAGASDGDLIVNVTGGTGAGTYTFAWLTNPSTTNTATGLSAAGNPHCVIVTDGNGCVDTACFDFVDPTPLTATNTQTNVSCNGGTNGTATVIPTGGTGTYTFTWDANAGGQTTATATGLPVGPYCVTVTDANGCQVVSCLNITEPTLLTTTATIASNYNGVNVSCNGSNDGIVFATPTGGTMPYTYAWSTIGAGTADTMTNASAGQVIVIVTDSLGCTATDTVVLTQPTPITASITASTNATCNGQCDGTATATGAGGTVTTGYTFLWSATASGQTTATASNLCAGTHTVTVTDNNGCSNVTSVIITEPLLGVSASATVTSNFNGQDVSCNGVCDGTATALGAGGTVTTGYTYLWDANAGNQVTDTAFNLCAGVYTVTISDNGGCSNTAVVTITEPSTVVATISSTVSVSCGGGADGQATVTGSGGTTSIAGYTYLWDATAGGQTTATATNLPGGVAIYVTVTDNNGCEGVDSVIITQPANVLLVNPVVTSDYNGQDISCATVCDGAAQVQVAGGIPGYNITWSTGATVDSITGLCAGTYVVTVTDNGGCTVVDSVVVAEPATLLAGIVTQNNVSCTGGADACVEVGALGGTPGYTYAIQTGVTQANNGLFCNLGVGTYTVTVTDLNFCLTTVGVTITEPAALPTTTVSVTSNYNGQDVSCFGACDGILTATPSGGTAPYSYSWSGTTQTTQTVTGMCAGTYSVLITDSLGCTASSVVTVTNPAQLTGALTSTVDALCFGDSTGAATFTVTGGTAPYTYSAGGNSVTTVSTSGTVTGLVAAGYTGTITDANGCIVSVPFIISSPPQLIATATVTSAYQNGSVISCAGTCDGAATAVGVGGIPGSTYNFLWSSSAGGQTTFTATALCAGTHTVSITDNNGCVAVDTVVLVEPLQLAATSTQVDVNCFGDSTGSIQMTGNGGTPIYTYTLGGQTNFTGLFTNLTAGTYCITVRDTNGCSIIECVTINQNTQLQTATFVTSNFNGAQTSCFSSADGVARVNVTGGQATYNYQWSTIPVQTTQIATGLTGGTYTVTVTDNLGCIAIDSVVVIPADSLILSVTDTVHVACFGQPTGSFTVAASGGVGPYLYSFDGGMTFTNTVQYTNLPANMIGAGYCVIVRDNNGCETTTCININEPTQLQGLADSLIMVSCFGGADGLIAVTGVGGTTPYLYSFNGGSFDTTRIFVGLSAQVYTVDVQDANGCIFSMTNQIITQPSELILTVDTLRNPTCTGQCDGVIELSALDGTPGYEFSIDGVNYQTSGIFSGLCAGGYTVYVRDAQGCITSRTVLLVQPTPVVANAAVTSFYPAGSNIQFNVSCFGTCDGSAVATPTGGTASTAGTYTYQWSVGGATTAAVTGLCANTVYTVTVTDANGCTNVDSVILTTPTQLAGVFTQVTPETCAGDDNGVIVVTATSGTGAGSYTYDIGAGQVTNGVFTNLTGSITGTPYSVTITDANGCTAVLDTLIFEPSSVTILATSGATSNYNGFDISCFGAADGELTVVHTGGIAPISYLWDVSAGAQQTATATGLRAGTYCVTVTDANGCAADTCMTLTQPTPLTMTAVTDSAGCTGATGGSVSAIPTGGTGVYTYAIDSTGTGPSVFGTDSTWSNLTAGTYVIYVNDQNDCGPVQQTVTVGQGAPIVATINVLTPYNGQQISCNGASDATATVTATGGTVGGIFFTYLWSDAQTGSTATNLGVGTYFVTITDTVSNCIEVVSVTVVEPDAVTLATDTIVNVGCFGTATGAIQVTATGGTPGYTYSMSFGPAGTNTTGIFSTLPAGTYDVYAIDANGCGDTLSVTIGSGSLIAIDLDSVNISCSSLIDGQVTATVTGGTPFATGFGYNVSWTGPSGPIAGIDTLLNLSAGTYTMTVLDAASCPQMASITVLAPAPILVTATNVVPASCGDSTGSITLTGSGGPSILDGITGAYEFSLDGGTTFTRGTNPMTFNNLASGSYQIVIRDTNNTVCIDVETVDLGSNSDITGFTTTTNETCDGFSDGTATALASSPSGGFTYQWFTDLVPGVIFDVNQTATNLTGNVYDADGDGILDTVFTYFVIVTDASPCSDTFPAYVLAPNDLTVNASLIQDVSCFDGNDGAVTAAVVGRDSSVVSFLWNNGATTNFANDLSTMGMDSMPYIVTITDTAGCTSSDTVFVSQPSQPVTGAYTGNTVSCSGNTDGVVSIDSVVGGTSPYLYSFAAIGPYGSDAILSQGLSAGVYTVYTQDANGCIDSTENIIIRDTINYIVTAFMDQTINMGETVDLYGTVNNSGIDSSLVTWSKLDPNTGIMSLIFTGATALEGYTPDTFFTDMQFVLSLNNGCGDSSIVTIEVNQEQTVFVPNAFSPNGDGTNDIFTVYGSNDVSRVKSFMVFDRWGEVVHIGEDFAPNSIDPNNGWDGTFRGKAMNPAVFVYFAEVELTNGETVIRKGDVTLIR